MQPSLHHFLQYYTHIIDEDDHHDDVVHYLQSLTNEDLVALGSALGVSGSRMANVNELAGN